VQTPDSSARLLASAGKSQYSVDRHFVPCMPPLETPEPVPVLPVPLVVAEPVVLVLEVLPPVLLVLPPEPGMHAAKSPQPGMMLLPQPARAPLKTRGVIRMRILFFRKRSAAAGRGKIAGGSAGFA
jgi:hypothetical protein